MAKEPTFFHIELVTKGACRVGPVVTGVNSAVCGLTVTLAAIHCGGTGARVQEKRAPRGLGIPKLIWRAQTGANDVCHFQTDGVSCVAGVCELMGV